MPRLQAPPTALADAGTEYGDTQANTAEVDVPPQLQDHSYLISNFTVASDMTAAQQQVHIISSDEEVVSVVEQENIDMLSTYSYSSCSVNSDFAGFSSPDATKHTVSPTTSDRSLKHCSQRSFASLSGAEEGLICGGQSKSSPLKRSGSVIALPVEVTPVKRKRAKHVRQPIVTPNTDTNLLQTPTDQIVEIDSNSTNYTQRQLRLQRQKEVPVKSQKQKYQQHTPKTYNRRSTETSSEFPVSSPSNPQACGGGKYAKRPPLLKNTLPADTFERNLALITSRNPQMSLAEKMHNWQCNAELSDVEDVNNFDDLFKKYEEQNRKRLRVKKNSSSKAPQHVDKRAQNCDDGESQARYDFTQFRARMQRNLMQLSRPASAKTAKTPDTEKPTTSAAAVAVAGQRRLKANPNNIKNKNLNNNLVAAEIHKRSTKYAPVKKCNSTTPRSTSSSGSDEADDIFFNVDNEDEQMEVADVAVDSSKKVKNTRQSEFKDVRDDYNELANAPQTQFKISTKSTLVYDKMNDASCNTEETSQQAATMRNMQHTNDAQQQCRQRAGHQRHSSPTSGTDVSTQIHLQWSHTNLQPSFQRQRSEQCGLIQMRLDFLNEKKDLHLKERASELFKTPTVPPKYVSQLPPNAEHNQSSCLCHNNDHNETNNGHFKDCNTKSDEDSSSSHESQGNMPEQPAVERGNSSFHQQHEFCNYLGLTGMSTANAVANAVAELAKCNMNRRSLRVQRLQQQEKREQSVKNAREEERKGLEALKLKQLRELRRREQESKDILAAQQQSEQIMSSAALEQHDSYCQPSHTVSNMLTTAASALKYKTEPEIKILCQISSSSKEEAEEVSRNYAKQLVAPMRQTLLRHLKYKRQNSSNGTSTCPRSSRSDDEQNAELSHTSPTSKRPPDYHREASHSPQSPLSPPLPLPAHIKTESPPASWRNSQSPQLSSNSPLKLYARPSQELQAELMRDNADNQKRMQLLHTKFQQCLEASRKAKPSIFIVKSLASGQAMRKSTEEAAAPQSTSQKITFAQSSILTVAGCSTTTIVKHSKPLKISASKTALKSVSVNNLQPKRSQGRMHKLLTRSSYNMRQLRNRKIFVVKAKKHALKAKMKERVALKVDKATLTNEEPVAPVNLTPPADDKLAVKRSKVDTSVNTDLVSKAISKHVVIAAEALRHKEVGTPQHSNSARASEVSKLLASSIRKPITRARSVEPTRGALSSVERTRQKSPVRSCSTRGKFNNMKQESLGSRTPTLSKSFAERMRERATVCAAATGGGRLKSTPPSAAALAAERNRSQATKCLTTVSTAHVELPVASAAQLTISNTPHVVTTLPAAVVQLPACKPTAMECDNVVVSSTTNTYDETMLNHNNNNNHSETNNAAHNNSQVPEMTKDAYKHSSYSLERNTSSQSEVQLQSSSGAQLLCQQRSTGGADYSSSSCNNNSNIHYLASPPSKTLQNPLQSKHGEVLYIFYELDVLIVVQESLVSLWKYSKLINMLALATSGQQLHVTSSKTGGRDMSATAVNVNSGGGGESKLEESSSAMDITGEWLHLGECKRLVNDVEIDTPYINRICMHNSMPIYVEMRGRELSRERRDCNLLSMYINIYYYHDDELHAKMHSIQLDAVQSLPHNVIYTTIPESRYFVMSWPQENILGKVRSGLCKYSLTPHLDTLASIREFKSMRHELLYLECTMDDKLLGFGATQLTIWDHRSGDVLMNYDLDLALGRNLGSIYYPSLDIGQNNMILLFQYQQPVEEAQTPPELLIIACNISHTAPSHRVLQRQQLPQPAFNVIKSAVNTGEHLLITAQSDEEIWISCADPNMITCVAAQRTRRYYARGRTQLIELTENTLSVDSFANHVLKLAAATNLSMPSSSSNSDEILPKQKA